MGLGLELGSRSRLGLGLGLGSGFGGQFRLLGGVGVDEPVEVLPAEHLDRLGAGRILDLALGLTLEPQLLPLLVLVVLVQVRVRVRG